MKKLLLFFTAITLGLSLTSCLDGGSQNFTEPSFVYIDQYQMTTYGKALNGRGLIYSDNPSFQMLEAKTFNFLTYSWEEESGYKAIGENNAFNVAVASEIIKIPKKDLISTPVSEETPETRFSKIDEVVHDPTGVVFDDNWLIQYTYMAKEDEKTSVEFYLRASEDESPEVVDVDLRLIKTGTPKEGATDKLHTNYITVDMAYLRMRYLNQSDQEIKVKFHYYVEGSDTPSTVENSMKSKPN